MVFSPQVMPLSYPYERLPDAGTAFKVAPGVNWVRMPLPFALDHVNLWLLEDGVDASGVPACTVVDTGAALDPTRDNWRRLLATHRLKRQIVTHYHPDHLGLAAWLERETGAPLWMTLGEYTSGQLHRLGVGNYGLDSLIELCRRHGLDERQLAGMAGRGNSYAKIVPEIPATFRRLFSGETVLIGADSWRVIVGYGHAPEHASLYCERLQVLISGDMMLPGISTNVSVQSEMPDANPLALFLESIAAFSALPAETLVLPSHGKPFRGLHQRIAELQAHHRDRCEVLLGACATPKTAAELIPVLFQRDIGDPHQLVFAMGEAIAHLNYLHQSGVLARELDIDVFRFRKAH